MMRIIPYKVFTFRYFSEDEETDKPDREGHVFYDTVERRIFLLPPAIDRDDLIDQEYNPIRWLDGAYTIDEKIPIDDAAGFARSKRVRKLISNYIQGEFKLEGRDGYCLSVNLEGLHPVDHVCKRETLLEDGYWKHHLRSDIFFDIRANHYFRKLLAFHDPPYGRGNVVVPHFCELTQNNWLEFQSFEFRRVHIFKKTNRALCCHIVEVELKLKRHDHSKGEITRWDWCNGWGNRNAKHGPYPVTFKFEQPRGCTIENQRINTPQQLYYFMTEFVDDKIFGSH